MIATFAFARTPQIIFGPGKLKTLPGVIGQFGSKIALLTGKNSLTGSAQWPRLLDFLQSPGIKYFHEVIDREPTPGMVDGCVDQHEEQAN